MKEPLSIVFRDRVYLQEKNSPKVSTDSRGISYRILFYFTSIFLLSIMFIPFWGVFSLLPAMS